MSLHIAAKQGEIAEGVLMPGDPKRAAFIADNFLTDVICYTDIRGMLGFTGSYKGKRVSVQGSGMGMPSLSIYANELINDYGCRRIMRIGTCGCYSAKLTLGSILFALGATTDSGMNKDRFGNISFAPVPDFKLLRKGVENAERLGFEYSVGNIFTSDKFYDDRAEEKTKLLVSYGILACEMETAELYTLGARYGIETLSLLSVSDNILTGEKVEPKERESVFTKMMKVALETI